MQNCDCVKFRFHVLACAVQKHTNLEKRAPRPGFVDFLSPRPFHNFHHISMDYDGVSTYIFGRGLCMTEVSLHILSPL
jgi:hypothetical protein